MDPDSLTPSSLFVPSAEVRENVDVCYELRGTVGG